MKINELDNENPKMIMLIGLPGTGKSTWRNQFLNQNSNYVILSTDDFIETWGKERGLNYSQAFQQINFKKANQDFNQKMKSALENNQNIIVDRTNLTKKSRQKILNQIPDNYEKIAYVFNVDEDELQSRLTKRAEEEGKTIPQDVLDKMAKSYSSPDKTEFDKIYYL